MPFPKPEPGLVISYDFLWSHEAAKGRVIASNTRPSVIVLSVSVAKTQTRVAVAPITHTPAPPEISLEIPSRVKEHLQLDHEKSWMIATELNEFIWPGFDLRPIPGTRSYAYGFLPPKLFNQFIQMIDYCHKNKIVIDRNE